MRAHSAKKATEMTEPAMPSPPLGDEPRIPDRCADCGDGFVEWTIDGDGRALCPDCAGF
jgi:formylmethanofuran dehydrogenase subunit E